MRHFALQPDGSDACPEVEVRPVPGLQGCEYVADFGDTHMKLKSNASQGPLADFLREHGYLEWNPLTRLGNLHAATYDWRVTPSVNEASPIVTPLHPLKP